MYFPSQCIRVLLVVTSSVIGGGASVGEQPAFEAHLVIRASIEALNEYHLYPKRIDDQLSRDWLAAFLNRLDPYRMYFMGVGHRGI